MIKSRGVDPSHPPAGASAASGPHVRFWVQFIGPDPRRKMDTPCLSGRASALPQKKMNIFP